jgi:hypothetical protein
VSVPKLEVKFTRTPRHNTNKLTFIQNNDLEYARGMYQDMTVIRKILIGILVISLITFVALFGQLPQLRKTPIGWLQRALCLHLPNAIKAVDRKATGGKLSSRGKKLGHYLFYQKNPIVLVCLVASKILRIRMHVNKSSDPLPHCPHGMCHIIPIPRCPTPLDSTSFPHATPHYFAIHLHLPLRQAQGPQPRPSN